MPKFQRQITILSAAVFFITIAYAPSAFAMQDDVWGPWYSTKCKDTPINSPLGGRNIAQPQINIPGQERSKVCQWERKKNDCPKLTSKIMKPKKCFIRFDKSPSWSANPPSN